MSRVLRVAVMLAALPLLSACNLLDELFGSAYTSPGATISHYSAFGNDNYDATFEQCYIPSGIKTKPSDAANAFASAMDGQEQLRKTLFDGTVQANQLVAAENDSDVLWFSGHGDPGLMQLYFCEQQGTDPNYTSWGPGSSNHEFASNTAGFPVQGLLKWIFSYSSDTAAVPAAVTGNGDYSADWTPAFGGTLHGLYGFYQIPGACPLSDPGYTNPGETCDIPSSAGPSFARSLVSHLMTSRNPPEAVHNSWKNAANDAGIGNRWSMWENVINYNDFLSGEGGPNPAPGAPIAFYYAGRVSGYTVRPATTVGNDTFQLNPVSLNPEALDDSTLLANFQNTFGVSASGYTNDGTTSTASYGPANAMHYLSTSAVSVHSVAKLNAMAFDQNTAQDAATQAAGSVNGLPADAVLTDVAAQWQVDPVSGGTIQTGYLYTWKHSSAIASQDAIRVEVTDYQTRTRTCTGGYDTYYDSVGRPHTICMGWTYTYNDQPNISYMFRMWHTSGAQPRIQSLGQTSITAATAAASLPPGSIVVAYAPGNWNGPYDDPSANTATPAWVFTLDGGAVLYVDAYTGELLGST